MVETGASTKFSQCREKAPTRAFSLLSRLKSPALTWLVAGGGAEMESIFITVSILQPLYYLLSTQLCIGEGENI